MAHGNNGRTFGAFVDCKSCHCCQLLRLWNPDFDDERCPVGERLCPMDEPWCVSHHGHIEIGHDLVDIAADRAHLGESSTDAYVVLAILNFFG